MQKVVEISIASETWLGIAILVLILPIFEMEQKLLNMDEVKKVTLHFIKKKQLL